MNYYPKNRKPARRPKDSYLSKDQRARLKQAGNLLQNTDQGPTLESLGLSGEITLEKLQDLNIIDFAEKVLKVSFKERPAQKCILKSIYGLPLTPDERKIYLLLTDDVLMPDGRVFQEGIEKREVVLALGARAGKSTLSSVLAVYEAVKTKWRQFLQPDEVGYCQLYATREKQSIAIIGKSCLRLLENSRIPHLVEESTVNTISLENNISIESFPASATSGRGLPTVCLICDEFAHFSNAGPKADSLIVDAIRPRLSQFEKATPKIIYISTPSAKAGVFWDTYSQGPRVPGRLTMRGSTRLVNPTIEESFIERERARDEQNCRREFGAEFLETRDAFFPSEETLRCFVLEGDNLPSISRHRYYCGCDQSGAAGKDRFAFTIAHREKEKVIVDVTREWTTRNLDLIFKEIEVLKKDYSLNTVLIDRYAAGYVSNHFENIGMVAELRPALPVIYVNGKRLVMANQLDLPDKKSLKTGMLRTQCYYGRNNSLSIDHERSLEFGHGDVCDSTMSAIWAASNKNEGGYFANLFKE